MSYHKGKNTYESVQYSSYQMRFEGGRQGRRKREQKDFERVHQGPGKAVGKVGINSPSFYAILAEEIICFLPKRVK